MDLKIALRNDKSICHNGKKVFLSDSVFWGVTEYGIDVFISHDDDETSIEKAIIWINADTSFLDEKGNDLRPL